MSQPNLFSNIEYSINEAINSFVEAISKNYQLDSQELKKIWQNVSSNGIPPISPPKSTKSSPSRIRTPAPSPADDENDTKCIMILKSGKSKGNRCSKNKTSGCDYCGIHKKSVTNDSASVTSHDTESTAVKKSVDKVLRKHKVLDKFWHPESKMVFKSKNERVVIGRESNDVVHPLTSEDKEVCIKYGFKFEDVEKIDEDEEGCEETKE